jgi:DNA polymerase-4
VAPNKFVAKLASDLDKPDGLTVIPAEGIAQRLATLAIERMWGVGPVAAQTFHRHGLKTFGDVQRCDEAQLEALFGESGPHWRRLAFGLDEREVSVGHEAVTVGHEQTFGEDLRTAAEVEEHLLGQADEVAARLRRKGLQATRVTVKIRYSDFTTITRARMLDEPTDRSDLLRQAAREVFRRWASREFQPVRLIGCTASGLVEGPSQLSLFPDPSEEKHRSMDRVADAIRAKFGRGSIGRADAPRPRGEPRRERE